MAPCSNRCEIEIVERDKIINNKKRSKETTQLDVGGRAEAGSADSPPPN